MKIAVFADLSTRENSRAGWDQLTLDLDNQAEEEALYPDGKHVRGIAAERSAVEMFATIANES